MWDIVCLDLSSYISLLNFRVEILLLLLLCICILNLNYNQKIDLCGLGSVFHF